MTFGEQSELEEIMYGERAIGVVDASNMMEGMSYPVFRKFVAKVIMIMVKKMINKDGGDVPVTIESLNSLSITDGKFLQIQVMEMFGQKKSI